MTIIKYCRFDLAKVYSLVFFIILNSKVAYGQISNPVFNWAVQEISKDNNLQGMSIHNDNTAVIAGYGRTFKITVDKGISWNDVGLLDPKYNLNDISISGKVGYMVGRKSLLVDNPTGGEEDVFASGVLLKTADGGESWQQIDLSKVGEGIDPALNPSLPGCITLNPYSVLAISETDALFFLHWYDVLSGVRKAHSAVFKTVNGGGSWKAVTPDLAGAFVNSMKLSGSDIFIGGNKILLKGSTTTDTTIDLFPSLSTVAGASAFVNEIKLLEANHLIVVTTNGVYSSPDWGATFSKMNGPTGGFDFFKVDENTMIVLGATSVSKATKDGGATWVSCNPGKACFEIPGTFNDSLYALSSSVIYKIAVSDLKSGTYKWVAKTLVTGSNNLQKMYRFNDREALIIGDDQIIKKTTDKGITWQNVELPTLKAYDGKYDFRSVSSSETVGYATTRMCKYAEYATGKNYYQNGLIFKTEDAWKTWKVLNTKNVGKDTSGDISKYPLSEGCYGMDNYTIECVDAQTAYVNVSWSDSVSVPKTIVKHSRVFKTTDGGGSWSAVTNDFGSSVITSIRFSGEVGYISGNKILLKTVDGGKTFVDLFPKISAGTDGDLTISSIVMRSKDELYFQTSNNRGVFFTKDGGNTFSKLNGVAGGLDFVALDNNSFMSLGTSALSKFTNDGGLNWTELKLGATIYAAGKVLNDSLYVLGKSNIYKIAVKDLDIKTGVSEILADNPLKVSYGSSSLNLYCTEGNIDRCFIYNVSGQLMNIADPRASTYSIDYSQYSPGIYILSAQVNRKRFTQKVIFK